MTLRAPVAATLGVLPVTLKTATPDCPFPMLVAVPLTLVPMKLPCTRLPFAPEPEILTPFRVLFEIRLHEPVQAPPGVVPVVPPMVLFAAPLIKTPFEKLPRKTLPVAVVPI